MRLAIVISDTGKCVGGPEAICIVAMQCLDAVPPRPSVCPSQMDLHPARVISWQELLASQFSSSNGLAVEIGQPELVL
jgi:hypothetical protein